MKNVFKTVGLIAMMGAGVAMADDAADLAKKQAEAIAQAQKAAAEAMKDPEMQKKMAEAQKAAAEAMKDPEMQKKMAEAQKAAAEAMKDPAVQEQMKLAQEYQAAVTAGDTEKAQAIQKKLEENAKKVQEAALKAAAK